MAGVCVITGASSGIGRVAASRLVDDGWTVAGVVRDTRAVPPGVIPYQADLSRLDDVRTVASALARDFADIEVLVNNAGAAFFHRTTTPDGFESTLAVNHLAPYLLTRLLPARRVVMVASEVHRQVREIRWDDLNAFHPMKSYNASKLYNVLFARSLAKRDRLAVSQSPGFVRSGLARDATGLYKVFFTVVRPFQTTPQKGAETLVHAATAPDVVSGEYYEKCRRQPPSALAQDADAAERMWKVSAELTGLPA